MNTEYDPKSEPDDLDPLCARCDDIGCPSCDPMRFGINEGTMIDRG